MYLVAGILSFSWEISGLVCRDLALGLRLSDLRNLGLLVRLGLLVLVRLSFLLAFPFHPPTDMLTKKSGFETPRNQLIEAWTSFQPDFNSLFCPAKSQIDHKGPMQVFDRVLSRVSSGEAESDDLPVTMCCNLFHSFTGLVGFQGLGSRFGFRAIAFKGFRVDMQTPK